MHRYKVTIEYQGTRYSGWQVQKNARTVQGEILAQLGKITGESEIELYGSGRTDAGVHALCQVAHLELRRSQPAGLLRQQLNEGLPSDIHILSIEPADPRFHARHHAAARSYLYQISRRRTAFGKKLIWWVKEDLDVDRMRRAAGLFVGLKDCRSFSAEDAEEKSSRVLIERVQIAEAGSLILIRIEGSHFLWKMVRRIVGVLVEAGKGKLTNAEISRFFEEKSERVAAMAAPASGLFLERVYYERDARPERLEPVLAIAPESRPPRSARKDSGAHAAGSGRRPNQSPSRD